MVLKEEKEFKIGNCIYTDYSYDGGFGRGAEIYEIVGVNAKSINIKKICKLVNWGPKENEIVKFIDDDEVKTVEVKKVTKKRDFYSCRLGQKYVVISDDHNVETRAWANEQFTSFSDIRDTGSYYELSK